MYAQDHISYIEKGNEPFVVDMTAQFNWLLLIHS